MKRKIHLLGLLCLLGLTLTLSSFKNEKKPTIFEYSITFSAGHTQEACNGIGETCGFFCQGLPCPCHIPCWGEGTACQHTITIGFLPASIPDTYNGIMNLQTDGFNGEVLNMPARSALLVGGAYSGKFLNIPYQKSAISGYDPNNPPHLYSVTGLTITDTPLFLNQ